MKIQPASALKISNSPMVTTTATRTGAFSTGRMRMRSIVMPPRNEATSVSTKAAQNGNPALTSVQAM